MKRCRITVTVTLLVLIWASVSFADTSWKDDYREYFGFLIEVDDEIVAAIVNRNWTVEQDGEDYLISFPAVHVFSESISNWYQEGGVNTFNHKNLAFSRSQVTSGTGRKIELEACTVESAEVIEPLGIIGRIDHAGHFESWSVVLRVDEDLVGFGEE